MEIVSCILSCFLGVFTIILLSYFIKYWIDNRLSDTVLNLKRDIIDDRKVLKKKVKSQEELINVYQELFKQQSEEIVRLSSIEKLDDKGFTEEDVCRLLEDILDFADDRETEIFTKFDLTDYVENSELKSFIDSIKRLYHLEDNKND